MLFKFSIAKTDDNYLYSKDIEQLTEEEEKEVRSVESLSFENLVRLDDEKGKTIHILSENRANVEAFVYGMNTLQNLDYIFEHLAVTESE